MRLNYKAVASYYNVEGSDIKVETPILANILPLIGFGLTTSILFYKKKSATTSFGLGAIVGLICLLPKLYYTNNAIVSVKKSNEDFKNKDTTATSDSQNNNANDDASNSARHIATTKEIIDIIENLAKKNGSLSKFLPKKSFFTDVIENFAEEEKNATYDILNVIKDLPKNPTEDDIVEMMNDIANLEVVYTKELIDSVNARLNEITENFIEQESHGQSHHEDVLNVTPKKQNKKEDSNQSQSIQELVDTPKDVAKKHSKSTLAV